VTIAVDDSSSSRTYQSGKGRVSILDEWWVLLGLTESKGAFSLDMVSTTSVHLPWCALAFGALYCSCGVRHCGCPDLRGWRRPVTLGSDLAGALPALRLAAESRMVDTCRVRSSDAGDQWNEATKVYERVDPTYSYAGPCLIKFGATMPRQVDAVGQVLIEQQIEAHFPLGASVLIAPGHVVEVLTAASDPALVGREFRVVGQFHQTNRDRATAPG
jgi:hypothetical protein